MEYVTFDQLHEYGIRYSREHIRRLEKVDAFPPHFALDGRGRRIAWEKTLIVKYRADKEKLAADNAKAARKAAAARAKAKAGAGAAQ